MGLQHNAYIPMEAFDHVDMRRRKETSPKDRGRDDWNGGQDSTLEPVKGLRAKDEASWHADCSERATYTA